MSGSAANLGKHDYLPSLIYCGFWSNGAVSDLLLWLPLGDDRAQYSQVANQAAERKRVQHGRHDSHQLLYKE